MFWLQTYDHINVFLKKYKLFLRRLTQLKQTYIPNLKDWVLRPKGQGYKILDFVINELENQNFTGSLAVMGRSLGSASALELAATRQESIDKLIIESGFAHAAPLLKTLGLDPDRIGFQETQGFGNADKIRHWHKPLLIIHAQFDHIIDFSQGQALYNLCPSADKDLLMIPGANHNDIFIKGFDMYLNSLTEFLIPP